MKIYNKQQGCHYMRDLIAVSSIIYDKAITSGVVFFIIVVRILLAHLSRRGLGCVVKGCRG